jgi:hypothetical protein
MAVKFELSFADFENKPSGKSRRESRWEVPTAIYWQAGAT